MSHPTHNWRCVTQPYSCPTMGEPVPDERTVLLAPSELIECPTCHDTASADRSREPMYTATQVEEMIAKALEPRMPVSEIGPCEVLDGIGVCRHVVMCPEGDGYLEYWRDRNWPDRVGKLVPLKLELSQVQRVDSLCDSWHTLADAHSNESPVRAAILRCVDDLEALIAATPQEPNWPYCQWCGNANLPGESAHISKGGCPPQEPKPRFTNAEKALDAVRFLHRPWALYTESAMLYYLCEECCTDGGEYQSERCVSEHHEHGRGGPICKTAKVIADAEASERSCPAQEPKRRFTDAQSRALTSCLCADWIDTKKACNERCECAIIDSMLAEAEAPESGERPGYVTLQKSMNEEFNLTEYGEQT